MGFCMYTISTCMLIMHIRTNTYTMHSYIHTYIHIYTHTIHACMHTYICIHTYMHAYIHNPHQARRIGLKIPDNIKRVRLPPFFTENTLLSNIFTQKTPFYLIYSHKKHPFYLMYSHRKYSFYV